MFRKRWRANAQGIHLLLVHETDWRMRTKASVFLDDTLIASSSYRYNLIPIVLNANLPKHGSTLEATFGYSQTGLSRIHRLMLNGQHVSGVTTVPDTLGKQYPPMPLWMAILVHGVPGALIYSTFMIVSGAFKTSQPLTIIGGFTMFAVLTGITGWGVAKFVERQKRR